MRTMMTAEQLIKELELRLAHHGALRTQAYIEGDTDRCDEESYTWDFIREAIHEVKRVAEEMPEITFENMMFKDITYVLGYCFKTACELNMLDLRKPFKMKREWFYKLRMDGKEV